ncbi:MAG: 16S rRNA (guanine(966)-N(2))-methyltransferase RsmD [Verrucomicrobiota bacterium]
MRIIAGKAGRTAIRVPAAVARPTTDFVRQAVFSILADRVADARVLDLFAGSGALGLEALSRGATACTFVDDHRQSVSIIGENLKKARLDGGQAIKSDVIHFLRKDAARYDLIFADPPYWKYHGDKDHVSELLASGLIPPRLTEDGWFIAEISSHQKSPEIDDLSLVARREYGNSAILIYQATPG